MYVSLFGMDSFKFPLKLVTFGTDGWENIEGVFVFWFESHEGFIPCYE